MSFSRIKDCLLCGGTVCHEISGLEIILIVRGSSCFLSFYPLPAFKHWGMLLVMLEMSYAASATAEH